MQKLILFELNEVPWEILDYYCEKFPNSTLAKILPKSEQYQTVTPDEGHLSPWITWPTLHRGVNNTEHKIQDFGEDLSEVNEKYPPVWKILQSHGVLTGVFASMHSYPPPANFEEYAFYVPDPFAGESIVHPTSLTAFQEFNLKMSRMSGRNVSTGIDWKSAIALGFTLPRIGILPKTLLAVGKQLANERSQPWIRTRRRTYQSVLAFDVFLKLLRKHKPSFTTFLSNHVASTMHRYWAATFPNHYDEFELSDEWKNTYAQEIDFTMHIFDSFLARLVKFIDENPTYKLIVASSMGQKATEAKLILTETACKSLEKLMSFLGVPKIAWEAQPAMHPQYNLKITEENYVHEVIEKLDKLEIGGKPLNFRQKEGGFFSLDFGHRNLNPLQGVYNGELINLTTLGIYNEKVDDQTGSTAYHIPEGSLFVYGHHGSGANTKSGNKREYGVDTRTIVPSILKNFGISSSAYMKHEQIEGIIGS